MYDKLKLWKLSHKAIYVANSSIIKVINLTVANFISSENGIDNNYWRFGLPVRSLSTELSMPELGLHWFGLYGLGQISLDTPALFVK